MNSINLNIKSYLKTTGMSILTLTVWGIHKHFFYISSLIISKARFILIYTAHPTLSSNFLELSFWRNPNIYFIIIGLCGDKLKTVLAHFKTLSAWEGCATIIEISNRQYIHSIKHLTINFWRYNISKLKIPIVAISMRNLNPAPSNISDLLSDYMFIKDLIIPLAEIENPSDVAYLLVLSDHHQRINYPAYVKRYEIKSANSEDVEIVKIKYRKIAEHDHNDFEVEFADEIPVNIIVDAIVN